MLTAILSAVGLGGLGLAMVFIPGVRSMVFDLLNKLLRLILDYPREAAIALLIACTVWGWRGWSADNADKDRQIAVAKKAYKDLADSYVAAQREAEARQAQHDREDLAAQIILTRQVEQAHAQNEAQRSAAVDAYARAHPVSRFVRPAPVGGSRCESGGAGLPGDPGQPAPAPETADMVAITRPDLDDLTREAVSGAERFNYLDALIREGRAIRASDIPKPAFGAPQP